MFENSSEESEFWSNVPEGRPVRPVRPRIPRAHAARQRPANPLLRRTAALGVGIVLLVPVAMALRAEAEGSTAPLHPEPTTLATGTVPAETPAPDTLPTARTVPATIDIDALPEAVPVNTQASAPVRTAKTDKRAKVAAVTTCTTYKVIAGDAWISIARRTKVSLGDLLAANHATSRSMLYPGHSLCLPAGAVLPATTVRPTAKVTTTTKPSTPTTVKPPVLTPPPNTYSKAQVIQIIRDAWPDNLEDQAILIATRESGLVPTARNFCCYGLFQIYYSVHKTWLATIGVTSASQLWDPRVNARAAYVMYQRNSGFGPWR